MAAAKINLTVEQGATFIRTFVWKDGKNKPVNLTGYSAALQVRETAALSSPVLLELGSVPPETGITLGGTAGTITIEISDETTAALTFKKGVYDILLTPSNGKNVRILQGSFTVSPAVTHLPLTP
jgi:hypothetical protein